MSKHIPFNKTYIDLVHFELTTIDMIYRWMDKRKHIDYVSRLLINLSDQFPRYNIQIIFNETLWQPTDKNSKHNIIEIRYRHSLLNEWHSMIIDFRKSPPQEYFNIKFDLPENMKIVDNLEEILND